MCDHHKRGCLFQPPLPIGIGLNLLLTGSPVGLLLGKNMNALYLPRVPAPVHTNLANLADICAVVQVYELSRDRQNHWTRLGGQRLKVHGTPRDTVALFIDRLVSGFRNLRPP